MTSIANPLPPSGVLAALPELGEEHRTPGRPPKDTFSGRAQSASGRGDYRNWCTGTGIRPCMHATFKYPPLPVSHGPMGLLLIGMSPKPGVLVTLLHHVRVPVAWVLLWQWWRQCTVQSHWCCARVSWYLESSQSRQSKLGTAAWWIAPDAVC